MNKKAERKFIQASRAYFHIPNKFIKMTCDFCGTKYTTTLQQGFDRPCPNCGSSSFTDENGAPLQPKKVRHGRNRIQIVPDRVVVRAHIKYEGNAKRHLR